MDSDIGPHEAERSCGIWEDSFNVVVNHVDDEISTAFRRGTVCILLLSGGRGGDWVEDQKGYCVCCMHDIDIYIYILYFIIYIYYM